MCFHHLYIFTACGHSIYSVKAVHECQVRSLRQDQKRNSYLSLSSGLSECKPQRHPFVSTKIDRLCATCFSERRCRMDLVNSGSHVPRFEAWRWKVKYASPTAQESAWMHWGAAMVKTLKPPGCVVRWPGEGDDHWTPVWPDARAEATDRATNVVLTTSSVETNAAQQNKPQHRDAALHPCMSSPPKSCQVW